MRTSIRLLLTATMVAAVDCALYMQAMDNLGGPRVLVGERESMSVFVIFNAVGFSLWCYHRGVNPAFLLGFQVGGLAIAVATIMTWRLLPDEMDDLFEVFLTPIMHATTYKFNASLSPPLLEDLQDGRLYISLPHYLVFTTITTAPLAAVQLTLAVFLGTLVRRCTRARAADDRNARDQIDSV